MVGVTDANGNPVTDASGNPVTQLVTTVTPVAIPVTDASGNAVTGYISSDIISILYNRLIICILSFINKHSILDPNGNPVTETVIAVTDSSGNVVTNVNGNPVTQAVISVTDASGNIVTGKLYNYI